MDVDNFSESVDSISYFGLAPDLFPWREPRPSQIESRRAHMSDFLIFDVLLTSGGIQQPETLYPPLDVDSLKRLLIAINNSTYDVLKKNCLVYFLLKWYQDGREDKFRDEKCIPPQFASLADAYWHLDTGINISRAVSILSDARLNRDYASKILQALSLSEDSTPLILKYVRTAKPSLVEPDDLDTYITALTESSISDAWQFQRSFPEGNAMRPRLLEKVLEWCLSPKPRPGPLKQLMALPFSNYEQTLVHKYALHPPPACPLASVPVIQDLACVRLIHSGQYASAIKLDRQFSLAATNATAKMKSAMQDRRRMMDEIIAAMPAVERNVLETELEEVEPGISQPSAPASRGGEPFSAIGTNGLTKSWVHVSPPRPAVNGYSTPPRIQDQERPVVIDSTPLIPVSRNLFATSPTQSRQPAFVTSVSRSPASSSASPLNPLRAPPSAAGPSGLKYPPASAAVRSLFTPATPAAATPNLFSSLKSANRTPNAFYQPPPLNGVKRAFDADEPLEREPTTPPNPPRPEEDHPMDTDAQDIAVDQSDADGIQADGVDAPEQYPFSVFSHSADTSSFRLARTESQAKMPPGAYFSDSDEEKEDGRTTRQKELSNVVAPSQRPRETRSSQQSTKMPNTRRRLPGTLIEEEDEDEVPPLPSVPALRRPLRRGRSRSDSYEDTNQNPIQPRRSARLSAASLSPEPAPQELPPKPRKGTRTSAAASTAKSKSSARRR